MVSNYSNNTTFTCLDVYVLHTCLFVPLMHVILMVSPWLGIGKCMLKEV